MIFKELYNLILEDKERPESNRGIIFRTKGSETVGCCIGVAHGEDIWLSEKMIERMRGIQNLRFYAEGVAAKDPSKEQGMLPFLEEHFPDARLEPYSWDEITEEANLGTANERYNVVYTFMQHRFNNIIDNYDYDEGTMLEAMARPKDYFPKNSPKGFDERLRWLKKHMKRAGFYDELNQPYDKNRLLEIMDEMEYSVYPDQEFPNTSTYFGGLMHEIERERNQTIYNLMRNGGCCFAGAGHLVELKQQFPELEIIDEDLIKQ
jgi:hypothetical protein